MNKKNSIALAGFAFTLLAVLYFLQLFYDKQVLKNTSIKNYWLLQQQNKEFDIAFIGNSRVFNNIDIATIEQNSKLKGINLGLEGTAYAEQYIMLHLFTERNKVKTVGIEINYSNLLIPDSAFSYPFHEYYYLPFIDKDTLIANTIKSNVKREFKYYMWRYIPFSKYAEFNEKIGLVSFFKDFKRDHPFDQYGSCLLDVRDEIGLKPRTISVFKSDSKTISYLQKMISYCKQKGISVFLFTAPTSANLVYSKGVKMALDTTINNIASSNQLKYFNFERSYLSNELDNFKDNTHLNKKGAELFSKLLSDTLKK